MSCVVCGEGVSKSAPKSLSTTLRNFATAGDFLVKYAVIDGGANLTNTCSVHICAACLSLVVSCDRLLSKVKEHVSDLRRKHAVKDCQNVLFVDLGKLPPSVSAVQIAKQQLSELMASSVDSVEPIRRAVDDSNRDDRPRRRKADPVNPTSAPPKKLACLEEPACVKAERFQDLVSSSLQVKIESVEGEVGSAEDRNIPAIPDNEEPLHWANEPDGVVMQETVNSARPLIVGDKATCPWCKKPVRASRDEMYAHIVTSHSGNARKKKRCWDCGMTFTSDSELSRHLAEHRRILLDHVVCIHCRKLFSFRLFRAHVAASHRTGIARTKKARRDCRVKTLQCLHCPFWCTQEEVWNLHLLQAHGDEILCGFCDEGFKARSGLNLHLRMVHLEEPLVTCGLCGKDYYCWRQYFAHFPQKHPDLDVEQVEESCLRCGLCFSPKLLRKHMQEAYGEVSNEGNRLTETLMLVRMIQQKRPKRNGKQLIIRKKEPPVQGVESQPSEPAEEVVAKPSGEPVIQQEIKCASGDEDGSDGIDTPEVPVKISRRRKASFRPLTAERRAIVSALNKRREEEGTMCPLCSKCVGSRKSKKARLFRHFDEAHAIPDGKRCWDCGLYLATEAEWEAHMDKHRLENCSRVVCIHCRRAMHSSNLPDHIMSDHPNGVARTKAERAAACVVVIKCTRCPFWTSSPPEFDLHDARAHGTEESVWCEFCNEEIENARRFKYHMRTYHSGEVLCPKCGEKFSPTALQRHKLKCQLPLAMVKCPECDKQLRKYSLNHHLAAVHGIGRKRDVLKIQVCPECGYKAYGHPHLAAHMKTSHDVELPGLKEYKCKLCEEVYYHCREITAHVRREHGILNLKLYETGLVCRLCGERAAERGPFLEHLSYVHDVQATVKTFMEYVAASEEKRADQS